MNILEARRRTLGGEVYKKTAEGNPVSVRSLARMRPGLSVMGKSTQKTTTGAQLFDASQIKNGFVSGAKIGESFNVSNNQEYPNAQYVEIDVSDIEIISWDLTGCLNGLSALRIRYFDADGMSIRNGPIADESGTVDVYDVDKIYVMAINAFNEIAESKAMVNSGNKILPWEPYTGGHPSPSPDYPQEITSAGDDGDIVVDVTDGSGQNQFLTVQTPNGLPGIPVQSGGNYTDENGQQWVCDEIDFKRGKYVKRIDRKTFNATDVSRYANSEQYGPYVVLNTLGKYTNSEVSIMSDKFIPVSFEKRIKYINAFRIYVDDKGFCNLRFPVGTVISNLYEAKNLVNDISPKCIVVLKNPIETDLSQEQLSAYANLHTNRPTTIVSATDDAGIKLTYKTKKSLEVT